jgi:hypothetical protein
MVELPVTMQGAQPTISAKINGTDVRLIADSGAFYSMLSPGSASTLNLKLEWLPPDFAIHAVGGVIEPRPTTVKEFTLGTVAVRNVEFVVGGSEIGTRAGAVGVLGQKVLDTSRMPITISAMAPCG